MSKRHKAVDKILQVISGTKLQGHKIVFRYKYMISKKKKILKVIYYC